MHQIPNSSVGMRARGNPLNLGMRWLAIAALTAGQKAWIRGGVEPLAYVAGGECALRISVLLGRLS